MSTWVLVCTEECARYLVHEKAILPIRAHLWNSNASLGYQLIVLSVVTEEIPFSDGLSCLTSSRLEFVPAPSTWLLTSTWHTRAQFRLLFPPVGYLLTTDLQPVPCYMWNKCSSLRSSPGFPWPKLPSWNIAQLVACLRLTAFYWGGRCTDTAVDAGGSGKSELQCLRGTGEGGGGRPGENCHVREGAGHQLNISPCWVG